MEKKGFFKGKLAKSFSRVTKPSRTASEAVFKAQNLANYSTIPMVSNQPTGFNVSMQKAVSYFKSPSFYDHNGYANQTWGHGDENVDSKATTYISNVRERFKLDGELTLRHG